MALNERQLNKLRSRRVPPAGNRVAVARELAGVTQELMSDETGMRQSYISDVERGRWRALTVPNAHKFANYFGCHIEDLFPSREAVAV